MLFVRIQQQGQDFDLDSYIRENPNIDSGYLLDYEMDILKRYCQKSYLGEPANDECIICFAQYQFQEKMIVFPGCEHRYHSCCLDEWLKKESNCPMCRRKLRSALLAEIQRVHTHQ